MTQPFKNISEVLEMASLSGGGLIAQASLRPETEPEMRWETRK